MGKVQKKYQQKENDLEVFQKKKGATKKITITSMVMEPRLHGSCFLKKNQKQHFEDLGNLKKIPKCR
jgi:hypothetical protein